MINSQLIFTYTLFTLCVHSYFLAIIDVFTVITRSCICYLLLLILALALLFFMIIYVYWIMINVPIDPYLKYSQSACTIMSPLLCCRLPFCKVNLEFHGWIWPLLRVPVGRINRTVMKKYKKNISRYSGCILYRLDGIWVSYIKYLVYQKLFKWFHFCQVFQEVMGAFFLRHDIYMY